MVVAVKNDYQALQAVLRGKLITPDDPAYDEVFWLGPESHIKIDAHAGQVTVTHDRSST